MNQSVNKFDIKQFLDLLGLTSFNGENDEDLIVENGGESETTFYLNIERKSKPTYCPRCGSRMYSKGNVTRHIRHPVLQNGKKLIINLKQKKYRCTNNECNLYYNEEFGFVEKYKQLSSITPYLILADMKDINLTCATVSRRYQVSDTYVHSIMMRYLNFNKLPLSKIISIDEVFLDIEYDKRYVVIVRDFITGDIIDVLPNRYEKTLKAFFESYTLEERSIVEFVISDMYMPYIEATRKYLPNSLNIIDSFHIIEFINKAIRNYIGVVKKRYQKKNDDEKDNNNYLFNKNYKTHKDSVELVLLKRHDWVLLSKPGNEPEISSKHFSRKLGIYPTVERIQKMFMDLDPNFKIFKELKDKYLNFNDEYVGKPDKAKEALDKLIDEYNESDYSIFKEFARLLKKFKEYIVLSFVVIKRNSLDGHEFYQRLSNGPMEGFNRKPKDMKRMARGFSNFDFVRNRILWAERKNATILAIPKSYDESKKKTNKKRGPYKVKG